MLSLKISKNAEKFLKGLPEKRKRQLCSKIIELREGHPVDSIHMKNSNWHRTDSGEYRVIYAIEDGILIIPLIAKRNDGEVYSKMARLDKQLLISMLKK